MPPRLLVWLVFLSLLTVPVLAQELPIGLQRIVEYNQQLMQSVTLLGAFLGGLISFLSPCGFVLLPLFFTVAFTRKKAFQASLLFGLGLMATFTVFGFVAGSLGTLFNAYRQPFALVSGVLLAFAGLWLLAGKNLPTLQQHFVKASGGLASMFFLGALFGIGWTPCMGAVLAGILLAAGGMASPAWGALLLLAFSAGVVLPLVAASLVAERKGFQKMVAAVNTPFSLNLFGRQLSLSPYNLVAGLFLLAIGWTIASYGGTTPFMEAIQEFTPWDMRLWADLNDWLVKR